MEVAEVSLGPGLCSQGLAASRGSRVHKPGLGGFLGLPLSKEWARESAGFVCVHVCVW